jgi:hypothetical protein
MQQALYIACAQGETSKAMALLEEGADINGQDKDGMTPLHISCFQKALKLSNLLIEKGADVNIVDKLGRTALNLACEGKFTDIIPTLLKEGADPLAGVPESCARLISFNLARSGRCAACGRLTPHPHSSCLLILPPYLGPIPGQNICTHHRLCMLHFRQRGEDDLPTLPHCALLPKELPEGRLEEEGWEVTPGSLRRSQRRRRGKPKCGTAEWTQKTR